MDTAYYTHQSGGNQNTETEGYDVDMYSISATSANHAENGLIPDTYFRLYGTSDYGTDVNQIGKTNEGGIINFTDVEKGTYRLVEIKENDNYIPDETIYTVVVDQLGNVSSIIAGENGKSLVNENKPKY